jgi:hypothetical protein
MNCTFKTISIITFVSVFAFDQGCGLGAFDNIVPSTIASTAASANSSVTGVSVITYNTITDEPVLIVPPFRNRQSQT